MGSLTHTVSGDIASFRSAARVPIESLKCNFLPKQDLHGYSKPWPAGGGKNLFNAATSTPKKYVGSDGNIYISDDWSVSDYITASAETTYALTAPTTASSNTARIAFYDTNKDLISTIGAQEVEAANSVFTTPVDTAYVKISVRTETPTAVQLEKGSTATTYEPYENVCPIEGWNSAEVYINGIWLPPEYQRVEYLESNGSPYILTNIPIQAPMTFDSVQIFTSNSDQYLVGAAYDYDGVAYRSSANGTYGNKFQNAYNGYFLSNYSVVVGKKYHIVTTLANGTQTVIVDGNTIVTRTSSYVNAMDSTKATYGIFCQYKTGQGKQFASKVKLFSLEMHNATTSVGNFIPCYRKSDNEPGMYDTVSQTFFTNQGTGSFTCGPNCGQTIPVIFPILGKNKLSDNKLDYIHPSSTWQASIEPEDLIFLNGEFSGTVSENNRDTCVFSQKMPFSPGTYTISFDYENNVGNTSWKPIITSASNDSGWYTTITGGVAIAASSAFGHVEQTFTINKEFYLNLCLNSFGYAGITAKNKIYNLQLELGSTATTYEPYDSNNTVYGGYVDLAKGEIVATDYYYEIDENTTGGLFYSSGNTTRNDKIVYPLPYTGANKQLLYCNMYPFRSRNTAQWNYMDKNKITGNPDNSYVTQVLIGSKNENIQSISDYQNWLTENGPIQVVYELKEPIHYSLTPTQLTTLLDQNNIWSNTNSTTEVSYAIHDSAMIRAFKQRIINNEPYLITMTGRIAQFNTDMKAPLKECKVYFNPVQEGSGDPSPDNMRAISGWTGCNVYKTGKNLINLGTQSFDTYKKIELSYPIKAGTYKLSAIITSTDADSSSSVIGFWDKDGGSQLTIPSLSRNTRQFTTITLAKDCNLIYLYASNTYANSINDTCTWQDIQLELSSTVTPYESCLNTTVPVNWSDDYGTIYGGYVDLVKGELIQTYYQVVFNGTNGIFNVDNVGSKTARALIGFPGLGLPNPDVSGGSQVCYLDYMKGTTNTNNPWTGYISSAKNLCLRVDPNIIYSRETMTSYLQSHPLQVVYKLATPITYTLTSAQLKSLIGTNNIWSNTNGDITATYYTH